MGLFMTKIAPLPTHRTGTFLDTTIHFCAMVLESWETNFGMVVLHGNIKK